MLDIDKIRAEFPALAVRDGGRPRIYFDAPGGTQICRAAINAMVAHLESGTANSGGGFATSIATDALADAAHAAMADLLGGQPHEIAFGQNMTSLTFAVSRALGRRCTAGDEIVVTRLDHDANVAPWLLLARDHGLVIRWLDFDPETGRLALDQRPGLLNDRTRIVAVGSASNALGTLNDVAAIVRAVRASGDALVFVDAVQSVPHVPVDVAALGCDILVCSPYKFFGPHQGVLWVRAELAEDIEAYKVRPASTRPAAVRFETGTPSFEGMAGTIGAVEHLAALGGTANSRRARLCAGMAAVAHYERGLTTRFLEGIVSLPRLKLYGAAEAALRVPTFSFTLQGRSPHEVAEHLARSDILAWSGNFYAKEAIARLGLEASGGLTRVGFCHYTSAAEVDLLLNALDDL